jgi:hypothetical protein
MTFESTATLVLQNSTLSLDVDHQKLGHNAKLEAVKNDTVDRTIEPPVKVKFAKIREHYNELKLSFTNFAVTFRAYNEGVAYRFETSLPQSESQSVRRRRALSISPVTTTSTTPKKTVSFHTTNANFFNCH